MIGNPFASWCCRSLRSRCISVADSNRTQLPVVGLLNDHFDGEPRWLDDLGARARLHGHERVLRRHRLGRVDRDDPPGARSRRHADRHGRRLRHRPQRGARGARDPRPPRPRAAGHQVRHRPLRRRRRPQDCAARPPTSRGPASRPCCGWASTSSTCTTCTVRRRTPRSRRRSARWPSSSPRARCATSGCPRSTTALLRRAHAVHPIAAVQSEYSLWTRDPETTVLDALRELGVGLVPYSPLGRGFLTGTVDRTALDDKDFRGRNPRFAGAAGEANQAIADAVADVAARKGVQPAQVALAWVHGQAARLGHRRRTDPGHQADQVARAERRGARRQPERRGPRRPRPARRAGRRRPLLSARRIDSCV